MLGLFISIPTISKPLNALFSTLKLDFICPTSKLDYQSLKISYGKNAISHIQLDVSNVYLSIIYFTLT